MKKTSKIKMDITTLALVLTAVASIGMVVKGIMYQPVISANHRKAEEIKAETEYEKQKIKEIDEANQKVGTAEYTEKIAREKLGMIKTDEIVFVDISGQE